MIKHILSSVGLISQKGRYKYLGKGANIHPLVEIKFPESTHIGKEVILKNGVVLQSKTGIFIGDRVALSHNVVIYGKVEIRKNTIIGPNSVVMGGNHIFSNPSIPVKDQGSSEEGVVIEDDVWVGANVTILDGVTIQKGAVIGAGAVVIKNVGSYDVVAGVPAKKIRSRKKMIKTFYRKTSIILWRIKLLFKSPIIFFQNKKDLDKVRLIIGPGRSGTTWISKVLSHTETPIRSIVEPIYPLKAKFHYQNDRSSIPYENNKWAINVILKIFSKFAQSKYPLKILLSPKLYKRLIYKNNKNFQKVIVKEVHCLLSLESLVKKLATPTIAITRNVVKTIDSQLDYSGFFDPVFVNEIDFITNSNFLNKYFPKKKAAILKKARQVKKIKDQRKSIIHKKAITLHITNQMIKKLSENNELIMHVSYEEACESPNEKFIQMASHIEVEFGKKAQKYLKQTQSEKDEKYHPNSIFRNTRNQIRKENKFLASKEVKEIKKLISNI